MTLFEHRAAAYLEPATGGRLIAYRQAQQAARLDEAAAGRRKRAAAKDLLLGVTGLIGRARRPNR